MKEVSDSYNRSHYMFRTNLLSSITSLDTVFTANGICHISYVDCLLPSQPRKQTVNINTGVLISP